MNETPEWFQITADEVKTSSIAKRSRFFKVAAVAAPLVIVGGAMVAAHGGEDDAPSNVPKLSPTTSNASLVTSSTSSSSETLATSTKMVSSSNNAKVVTTSNPATAKSGIGVKAPTGRSEGDDGHFANDPDHGAGTDRPAGTKSGEHHRKDKIKIASAPPISNENEDD